MNVCPLKKLVDLEKQVDGVESMCRGGLSVVRLSNNMMLYGSMAAVLTLVQQAEGAIKAARERVEMMPREIFETEEL